MPPAGPGGVLPFSIEEAALPQERPLLLDRVGTVTSMSILNRRNAVVGWLTTKVVKRVVKKKATDAVPSARTGGAAAGAVAALGGALFFWKKKRSGDDAGE